MAFVEPTITSTVASADSAKSAWDVFHTTYANKSQTRVFILRDQLARVTKDSRSITENHHTIWSFSDELATAGAPFSNPELIVKILSGLGPEFHEISTAIRPRDTAISYEELFEKLLDFELLIRHEDAKKLPSTITFAVATPTKFNSNNRNNHRQTNNSQQCSKYLRPSTPPQWQSNSNPNGVTLCQLCNRIGHTANVCLSKSHNHFEVKANYAAGFTAYTNPWIVDSGATHHITTEPHNLQPYSGNEDSSMGDGNKIPISHTGSTKCFDPISAKVYLSRDVRFVEDVFPFKTLFSNTTIKSAHLEWAKITMPSSLNPTPKFPIVTDLPTLLEIATSIIKDFLSPSALSPAQSGDNSNSQSLSNNASAADTTD
ncbi:uncharacterized protein [Solanum tuberosum]|uniref:uncharacterized protein n=1 Tax=Solanum tuberosum TaxID=4113 RepID=UPI00073A126E|nr:PREDICTED: uncharacterized protein LOC107057985 [Solanum tuberosum]